MAKSITLGLDDIVPGTKFTARQICRTRRTRKPVEPGTLLAYIGAYDKKYVVVSITLAESGVTYQYGGSNILYDRYVFCIQYLGKFNADGRVRPTPKSQDDSQKDIDVYIRQGEQIGQMLPGTNLAPVEPMEGAPLKLPNPLLSMDRDENEAWKMAINARDPSLPGSPWPGQKVRTPRQQEFVTAVKSRVYDRKDFQDLIEEAAKILAERDANPPWKNSSLGVGSIMDPLPGEDPVQASPPPPPRSPEAILDMFRIN